MTLTMGPPGEPWAGGDTSGLPIIEFGQYSEPVRTAAGTFLWWKIDVDELAYLRVDGLLSRQLSMSPPPPGFDLVSYVRAYRDGDLWDSGDSIANPEGITFEVDAEHEWLVSLQVYLFNPDTSETRQMDTYPVVRVSHNYSQTIQLDDRDCTIVFDDNTERTTGEVVLRTMGTQGWNNFTSGVDIGARRIFQGRFSWSRTFDAPYSSPAEMAGAVNGAWSYARERFVSGSTFYNADYSGATYIGEPSGPPGLGTGPDENGFSGSTLAAMTVGFELKWTTQGAPLIPSTMDYTVFGAGFRITEDNLRVMCGPLGNGWYYQNDSTNMHLEDYFEPNGLPLVQVVWGGDLVGGDPAASLLQAFFAPDETPASSASSTPPVRDQECTALWLSNLPIRWEEDDAPEWGVYLNDGYTTALSNRSHPENWAADDPTVQVLAITRGGGPFVELDLDAIRTYEADTIAASTEHNGFASGFAGFNFWCFPQEMWSVTAPDGEQDGSVDGRRAHFRGDARFALKLHVRPAPFTGLFVPPLEPADPPFPNLTAEPGPERRTFWPQ